MEIRTLCDILYFCTSTFHKEGHLLYKKEQTWRNISSEEFRRSVEELCLGLRALGVEKGERVAILSENRPEWIFADFAVLALGAADSPIYSTLTPQQVLYILNDSEARVVFVSNLAQARKITQVRSEAKHLKHVIQMDEAPLEGNLSFDEVRAKGRLALEKAPEAARTLASGVRPDDLATLIYTSGTTGDPKGVMLTHSNLVSNVLAAGRLFEGLGPEDIALSFLPLSHIFERTAHYVLLRSGITIAYAEGFDKVPQNMVEVRPTIMVSVPRLYEKMYARINEKVAADPPLRQRVFRWALAVGREAFHHRAKRTTPGAWLKLRLALADRLVFAKIRERTGGRLRLFISGGAPLAREIAEFFGAAGFLILEGYGLTETSPVITANFPDDFKPGSVGKPLPGVEVKIADDGEILTRGPHVMKGYFKKPEATAEAVDKDGWFHTGDIGVFDQAGFLIITDRKKDLIVTSGGKKIAPQPIENRLKADKFITEVVMVGNKRNFACALLIPNFDSLETWARDSGLGFKDRLELVARPEVIAHYERIIEAHNADLAQFEKIKKIILLPKEFSLETGELTPTLKVKRRVVEQKYKDLVDGMYGAPAGAG